MKKRLISMALCLLMLMTTVFTASCGDDEDMSDVGEDDVANAMTITIWGIKEKGTTDEAVAAVEAAMSSITKAQFNTAIKLELYTEAEYDKKLEARMDEIQAQLDAEAAEAAAKKAAEKEAKKNKTETTAVTTAEETSEEIVADETILNEYGFAETLYPEVEDDQLDIFLITDYEMFQKYATKGEKGVLSALDEQLSSSSKILKSYINPTLLAAGKIGKSTYAILNNQPVGEYTYLLLNKNLMDKYYYDVDNFFSLNDCEEFIDDVITNESMTVFEGDLTAPMVEYYPNGEQSVIGSMLAPNATKGEAMFVKPLPANKMWNTYMTLVAKMKDSGRVGATTIKAGDNFAIGVMKGQADDVAAFEKDYYIKAIQNPQGTTESIYNGMFAVSTYTKSLARSMEILTYLNTRSDLRNLFGYGIEGVHYELDANGVVKSLSKDYKMKLEYTGNEFVAYPPEGTDADIWERAKVSNLDLTLAPNFGFTYDESLLDPSLVSYVKSYTTTFFNQLNSKSGDEIADWLSEQWDATLADEKLSAFCAEEDADTEDEYVPFGKIYADWYNANNK